MASTPTLWARPLPFQGRSLTVTVHQLVVTSNSPPHLWSLNKATGKAVWNLSNPLGAILSPSLWNNMLTLIPNSTALQILNADSGETEWQVGPPFPPLEPSASQPQPEEHSSLPLVTQRILARPLREGKVLLILRGDGALVEINPDHKARVVAKLETPLLDDIYASRPTTLDGKLWSCSRRGYLVETSLKTGELLHSQRLASNSRGPLIISADLATYGDRIMAISEDGSLFSINPAKPQESWTLDFHAGTQAFASSGDLLLVLRRAGNDQVLIASERDLRCIGTSKGEIRWQRQFAEGISSRPFCRPLGATTSETAPRNIYVTTEDARLLELSAADGSTLRSWTLPSKACADPISDGENVYLALTDHTVCCYPLAGSAGSALPEDP